jgi:ParB family chromosome partitioning protein
MGHARALIALEQVDQQLYAYRETLEKGLSVRQTEALVKDLQAERSTKTSATHARKLAPAYKRIEDNMASHLSTRVILDRKNTGKGSVTIEFYNDEDLERIMEKMGL